MSGTLYYCQIFERVKIQPVCYYIEVLLVVGFIRNIGLKSIDRLLWKGKFI